MSEIFSRCIELNSIDISNFSSKKLINMGGMFQNCEQIKILNLFS